MQESFQILTIIIAIRLLLNWLKRDDEFVTASVASIPTRLESLKKVVESIVPQVNQLNVYLNGYEQIPPYLNDKKINVVRSQDYGDLRDNGKFFFLSSLKKGYHFTIDDDIQYPSNYIQKNILKLKQYDLKVMTGTHGVNMAVPIKKFYKDRIVYHFARELKKDKFVNLLGTGTLAYHTSTIKLNFDDFKEPGMADVWVAIAAKKQNTPLVTIEREKEWLIPLETGQENLYTEFLKNDNVQTKVMKANGPWEFFEQYDLYEDVAHRLIDKYTELEAQTRGIDYEFLRRILQLPVLKKL